ncbi:ribosome biogenesis protein BRX1 homolog [Eriocheir sinensis]|uniref:ribosome biogenesis protein BRX1 homolog n=1 Tax=Eriocheir sinensis TaxID=95602 RepID=UPI0021C57FD0|nr:ribosome biogenesis protein BRX1 homolog [Eriocheir sinensis]
MGRKRKRAATLQEEEEPVPLPSLAPPLVRDSDEPVKKKKKWINKQRVLVFASRGMSFRNRHLMEDMRTLMPHSKPESKKENKDNLRVINEIAEMKNCNKCVYFENRKKKDLYMWVANVPKGPSVKFLVLNAHTMKELKMMGNCLKGSRPLLSFDPAFDQPHFAVIRELLVQTFGTPNQLPKSQPFHDHVFCFSILDNKIWFRNYEVLDVDGKLSEIGPRFVLDPIKVFDGSFGGQTLWDNPHFVTPNTIRSVKKKAQSFKYTNKVQQKEGYKKRTPKDPFLGDPTNDIFQTKPPEEAVSEEKQIFIRKKI